MEFAVKLWVTIAFVFVVIGFGGLLVDIFVRGGHPVLDKIVMALPVGAVMLLTIALCAATYSIWQ